MTEPKQIDPERLAALLDGRLSDAEAAAVRQELGAADDDTLSAYADAVVVSAELGSAAGPVTGGGASVPPAEPTPAKVIPMASARGWRRWIIPGVTAAAAATIALVVVLPGRSGNAYRPATYASAVPLHATMPAEPAWGGTRGSSDGISPRARAVRVGALLTDIELGAIRGDTNSAHARELRTLLNGITGGPSVALMLDKLPTASSADDRRKQLDTIGRRAIAMVDSPLANTGAYLEAARAATGSGDRDVAFFDRARETALAELRDDQLLDSSMRTRIRNLLALIKESPRNGAAIHTAVDGLLRDLAR